MDRIEDLFLRQGFGLWALEVAATGEFIGFTGLNPMPPGVPGAGGMEVGWRLARDAWHHGYATEAALAAAEVAFGGAGLAELWSMTAVANEPSQAVMRRLGMTRHAYFDHPGSKPVIPSGPTSLTVSERRSSQSEPARCARGHGSPHRSRVGTSAFPAHIVGNIRRYRDDQRFLRTGGLRVQPVR